MPTTSFYDLPLINEGDADWRTVLNSTISRITEILAQNQKPDSVMQRWGDIDAGQYLECNGAKIVHIGSTEFSGLPLVNLVIQQGASFPVSASLGQLFYRTDENLLYVYKSSGWALVGGGTAAADGAIMDASLGLDAGSMIYRGNSGAGDVESLDPGGHGYVLTMSDPGLVPARPTWSRPAEFDASMIFLVQNFL